MALFDQIGEALVKARQIANYKSQTEAAKAAGVDQTQLSGWEKQVNEIRLGNLAKLLEAWGFSARDFGQIVDELNGTPSLVFERLAALEQRLEAGESVSRRSARRQLADLKGEFGLPEKSENSYNPEVQQGLDPPVGAQLIEELKRENASIRRERDDIQQYLGEIVGSLMVEVRKGKLNDATVFSILRPLAAKDGDQRSPATEDERRDRG